jgi:hypothetical protein
MNDLTNFVLSAFRQEDAIVEPPAYGVHEVLLPDEAAHRWGVPSFLRLTFDDALPEEADEIARLGYGHPLVETLAEERRGRLACAIAHVNDVRLDKRGLAQLARQSVGLPNARLTAVPRQVERPALCHYVVFNFKVVLLTDEKREQLVPVMMDLQAGHAVTDRAQTETSMSLRDVSAFEGLPPAPIRWMHRPPKGDPLTESVLSALLECATRAALDELAAPLQNLERRAARYLELDRARLTEYYDDLTRDLQRRVDRASDDERRGALEDRIKAIQIEREAKLADVEAKYHLRVEMTLVNLMVITQPKVLLPVQIGDRHTKVERTAVWDPLSHQLEPLVCDACGQPGERLFLCASGHLAHEECLLAEQCVDCKRLYCRLCTDQMSHCVVCDRPVCGHSLNRCGDCGRGTCREHVGLCHAADGEPARLVEGEPPAVAEPPLPPGEPSPEPPKPPQEESQRLSSARRQTAEQTLRQTQQRREKARRGVVGRRIQAFIHPTAPVVEAYVFGRGEEEIAVRTWELDEAGIGVWCRCEKGRDCAADGRLLKPARASGILDQMKRLVEDLAHEYGASTRRIEWHAVTRGEMRRQTGPVLWGDWKNDEKLALARVGFQVIYTQQFPWSSRIDLPAFVREMETSEAIEVGYVTQMAEGLLHFEGVLPRDELLARAVELARPGAWYTPERGEAILSANQALRPPTSSGFVSLKDTARPATLMKGKLEAGLVSRAFTPLELLDAADPDAPLPKDLARIERKLSQIVSQDVDVRHVQFMAKNQPSLESLLDELTGQYEVPEKRAEDWLKWLTRLWEQTPRYELGGRTPAEASSTPNARN